MSTTGNKNDKPLYKLVMESGDVFYFESNDFDPYDALTRYHKRLKSDEPFVTLPEYGAIINVKHIVLIKRVNK